MEMVTLNLGPTPTEAELESLKHDQTPYVRRWATNLLADLKSGKALERTYPYPLQVWQFGGRQLLITLGGEPVVDYALKFKREFGPQTWVAGYGQRRDVLHPVAASAERRQTTTAPRRSGATRAARP